MPTPKWKGIFEVWHGGLGIWGGILLGTLAGVSCVRRAGARARLFLDAAAPGLLLAQGIGRIGNWWNQELYGKPTTLPWGLKIDLAHRAGIAAQYLNAKAYQPTFLYELLWDLAGVGLLLWLSRRRQHPPAGAVRALRAPTTALGGSSRSCCASTPHTTSSACGSTLGSRSFVFVGSSAFFVWWQLLGRGGGRDPPKPRPRPRAAPGGPEDGDPARPRPVTGYLRCGGGDAVGELDLDLDAFEGPFDLLLTLVLREELALARGRPGGDRDHLRRAPRRATSELDLDACGEFLVLISALLELKARGLFPDGGGRARRARARGGGRRARPPSRRVPAREGGRRSGSPSGSHDRAIATSGSGRRRSRPTRPAPRARAAGTRAARGRAARARRRAARAFHRAHGARVPARLAVPRALARAPSAPQSRSTSTRRSPASPGRGRGRVPRAARAAQATARSRSPRPARSHR